MKKTFLPLLLAILLPAVAVAGPGHGHDGGSPGPAIGEPGDPAVARTVEVRLGDDMRFTPDRIEVRRGETVRFVVRNEGALPHEFVLGTAADLHEHAELMRRFPGMEHDDPNMVAVPPGETRELVWRFASTGTVDFACLVPGHLEAGMKGSIDVK